MEFFNVDTEKVLHSSAEIAGTASRIRDLMQQLQGINAGLPLQSSGRADVERALRSIADRAFDEAAKMDTLSDALEVIAEKYKHTEQTIIGSASEYTSAESKYAKTSGDSRSWWQKFQDWWNGVEPDPYTDTTKKQEKAADKAMKKQLKQVLKQDKYSSKNWDKASVEERKKILQDYMDEVIRIYGLTDVHTQIQWDDNATYTKKSITWGYYNPGTHYVTLNAAALTDSVGNWDSFDLLQTVSHELRHAYQHEAVEHPEQHIVSQSTLDAWSRNFDNYISSVVDYYGYRNQVIERDARDFEVKPGWLW